MDKKIMSDCEYNCVKQLSKQLKLLWNLDGYIKDARACEDDGCVKVFEIMKEDTEKHVKMLKEILKKRVEAGGFD